MENPASWTKDAHAINNALKAYKENQEAGVIGSSLAMYLEQVVLRPIHESYKRQIKQLTDEIRDTVNGVRDEMTWKQIQGEDYGSY